MEGEDFHDVQADARKLEKKALDYKAYSGDVHVEMAVDLSPQEYVDMTFTDLLNLYERTEKIRSASKLKIFGAEAAAKAPPPPPQPEESEKAEEVENKIKEMSTENVEMAEKIGEEMRKDEERKAEGKPEAAPPPEAAAQEKPAVIEFETIPAEEKERAGEEMPEEKAPEIELEKEKPPEAPAVEIPEEKPEAEAPPEKPVEAEKPPPPPKAEEKKVEKIGKKVIVAVPPVLKEDPDQAAEEKFDAIESKVKGALGERVNETELKKKMLELTKQLFKEKSVNRREEIKSEITVLKNLLSGKAVKGAAKGKKVTDTMANAQVLDSLVKSQVSEIATTKDNITGPFREQLETAKASFYESIKGADNEEKKKRYEALVFTLTSLSEQIPEVVDKYEDFMLKKHLAELEKLKATLGKKDTKTLADTAKRVKEITKKYPDELSSIRNIMTKEIDNIIESAGREVFVEKEPEPEKPEAAEKKVKKKKPGKKEKEAKEQDKIFEINEMDEGTLLFFLHSKDKDYYKKYERRQVSKAEAILKAKALMAEEKGLSDDMIKKYFSESEG